MAGDENEVGGGGGDKAVGIVKVGSMKRRLNFSAVKPCTVIDSLSEKFTMENVTYLPTHS